MSAFRASLPAIAEAVNRYQAEYEEWQLLAEGMVARIREVMDEAKISCTVEGRAKDPRSFHKKIIEKDYEQPWGDVTDKAGVRVKVESPSMVDRALAAIQQTMESEIVRIEDKRELASPSSLSYTGVHVQLRTPDGEREVELQLRTHAQDLWSVLSHKLLYKPIAELSPAEQHRVFRLVGLVEIFDEEVERVLSVAKIDADRPEMRLIQLAEEMYLQVAHSPSNRAVSRSIVPQLSGLFEVSEVASYEQLLAAFVDSERANLETIFAEYGPHSVVNYMPHYMLLGQAESLLILERLSCKPHALLHAWTKAALPMEYLVGLASAAGARLPQSR